MEGLFAVLLLLLQQLTLTSGNCAMYGCTLSGSFTCPTYFYAGSFWPDLAVSYQDAKHLPTGAGCVTNAGKVHCPLTSTDDEHVLMTWNVSYQFPSWNFTMYALITLPLASYTGEVYVTDGYQVCAFTSDDKPLGPCLKMEPVSGPLFEMTVVNSKFLYLLYRCGFMVAYFISDGTAYASIWLNTTVGGVNGTFIPLSHPAVSGLSGGERVYFVAGFKPAHPSPIITSSVHLRLYAIDVRDIMVERIKVAWYHDFTLYESSVPYLHGPQAECAGKSDPLEAEVANVLADNSVVVASVNYVSPACGYGKCLEMASTNSLMLSVTDNGDSTYEVNFFKKALPPFQTVVYPSPNFLEARSGDVMADQPPPVPLPQSVWVSWLVNAGASSVIENINITTGDTITKIDTSELKDILVTSKMAIFYNDGSGDKESLIPLVFGYASKGDHYIAAVDISPSTPELRWTVKTFDNAPAVGQITTVGSDRDTMMIATTTKGVFFYMLYSD